MNACAKRDLIAEKNKIKEDAIIKEISGKNAPSGTDTSMQKRPLEQSPAMIRRRI